MDISKAGPGELDIKVTGGEAPYKINEKQSGKYQVIFTPKQPGVLAFTFSFNKVKILGNIIYVLFSSVSNFYPLSCNILGGPWTCTVQSPPTIEVSGNGVESNPPIPVNIPTTFTVKVTGIGADLVTSVTGDYN